MCCGVVIGYPTDPFVFRETQIPKGYFSLSSAGDGRLEMSTLVVGTTEGRALCTDARFPELLLPIRPALFLGAVFNSPS